MKERSVMQMVVGNWNTKTIVAVGVGAALFGVLMVYGGIQVFTNTNLTTAMIIPVIVGGMFGAIPAALTCFVGNVIADLIGGWGLWFDWSVGNAVLGFFVGLLPVYGARITDGIFNTKHAVIFIIMCLLGCVVGFGIVTPIFTTLFYGAELTITLVQSLTGSIANMVVFIVAGVPLLTLLANRNKRGSNLTRE